MEAPMKKLLLFLLAVCLPITLAVSGCGGGSISQIESPPEAPLGFHAQTGTLPKIAYAGSPVRKSRSYINSYAVEPGETWLNMGDIGDIPIGDGHTFRAYETQRVIPDLIFDYAPGHRPDPELEAQVRRAFKLWTRPLDRHPAAPATVSGPRLSKWGTPTPAVEAPAFLLAWSLSTTTRIRMPCLSYRFRRPRPNLSPGPTARSPCSPRSPTRPVMLSDYRHPGLGYYNPETGRFEKSHAPRSAGQLMSPIRGDSVTIGPQTADLLGVRHNFSYGPALSPDYFGWWLDVSPTSALRSFGSGVARHFDVADIAGVSNVVASSESVTSDSVTSDYVKVLSWVDGFPTPPQYLDDINLGSATWTGALLAVDLVDYSPVIGAASLSMDLSALRLTAEFDNFLQGPDFDAWDGPSSLRYTLTENADGVWHDSLGRVDARFFAEFNASGELTDPAHAVAGHLDDDQAKILGAYGAFRD